MIQRKGAFLGAVNASSSMYPTPIDLEEALSIPRIGAPSSPYDKSRSRMLREYTKGLQTIPVPDQLSLPEAAALFEVWMKDLALGPCELFSF
jgi:small subunit ribosomal protein S29